MPSDDCERSYGADCRKALRISDLRAVSFGETSVSPTASQSFDQLRQGHLLILLKDVVL